MNLDTNAKRALVRQVVQRKMNNVYANACLEVELDMLLPLDLQSLVAPRIVSN